MSRVVIGTLARTLLILCAVLLLAPPLEAQLPDSFFGHFGSTRTREVGIDWSLSLGAMLVSQYGYRWEGPLNVWNSSQDFTQYDQLATTVGYNYLSGGYQWDWAAGGGWLVLESSGTFGVTSDVVTEWFQDEVHNFGRLPHVYRVPVDSLDLLLGVELAGSYWHAWQFGSNSQFELFPTLGAIWSSYHNEASVGIGAAVGFWKVRFQGTAAYGLLFDRSSVKPPPVAARLEPDYIRFQLSGAFDRNRVSPATARTFPLPGGGITWSSGIFPQEEELLLSVFLDFPSFVPNHSVRIEHVNDLINGNRDKGPTGGLRIVYVARN